MEREQIVKSKKELMNFLEERKNYFLYEERNPFIESRMFQYINNGINYLHNLKVNEDTLISMYDKEDVLMFEVVE